MQTVPIRVLLLIVASAYLSGCEQKTPEDLPSTLPILDTRMNCLFIVLDAFHASKSSLYGYPKPTTPNLEKWSKRGIVFDDATSQFTSTSGSSWSYLNGLYPYQSAAFNPMRDTDVPLAELFKRKGYQTGGFSDNPYINKTHGIDKGFAHFEYYYFNKWRADDSNASSPPPSSRERSEFLFDQLNQWIVNDVSTPWFAYVHTLRPHNTYAPPEPHLSSFTDTTFIPENENHQESLIEIEREIIRQYFVDGWVSLDADQLKTLHDLYLSSIFYIDYLLDDLLSSLEATGQLENTLIIITSDHGEAFGEHKRLLHGDTPNREQNHVPLVVIPPHRMNIKPARVSMPIQLTDLLPTLTEIFELNDTVPRDGQSLMPLMRGQQGYETKPIFSQSAFELAVISGDRKFFVKVKDKIGRFQGKEFVVPMKTQLYDLNDDPEEKNNLYTSESTYPMLMSLVENYMGRQNNDSIIEDPVLPDEEREALEALGYLEK